MNPGQKRHGRINYSGSAAERRKLSRYFQAGGFRRAARMRELEEPVRKKRLILYLAAGIFFGIGAFFILF